MCVHTHLHTHQDTRMQDPRLPAPQSGVMAACRGGWRGLILSTLSHRWVRDLSQNCPPTEGPPQTFPISWCPGLVDFGQPQRGPGERHGEAAPGRLAVLLCCVFHWPEISTSCSPLIIHRSCFLSPQYLGCLPASPPTGKIHQLQSSQACSWSMGFAVVTGFAMESRSVWLPPLCLGT